MDRIVMGIEIVLTAANMGFDCDEADFQAWHTYICENIDGAVGFEVEAVDMHPFGNGPAENSVNGATEDQEESIREWLSHGGWDEFCGTPEAWPKRDA